MKGVIHTMTINEKIEQIRKSKGITKKHIAEKCGHTPAWYTDILKGRSIKVDTLQKIADALEVDIIVFFEENLSVSHKNKQVI